MLFIHTGTPPPGPPRHARRPLTRAARGFTLIELLVVIAIIALLASILFPVFSRARENARRSSCMSNLKQIEMAVIQYTQDSDEKYPVQASNLGTATPNTGSTFVTVMQPYLKSTQVLFCPSGVPTACTTNGTSPVITTDCYWSVTDDSNNTTQADYGLNENLTTDAFAAPDLAGFPITAVNYPTETILSFESDWYEAAGPNPATNDPILRAARHFNGANFGFCDGHVKWYGVRANVALVANYFNPYQTSG